MAFLNPAIGRACFGAGPLTAAIVRASLGAGPLTPAQGPALSRACGHSCRITGTAALCLHGAELAAIYRTVKSPW